MRTVASASPSTSRASAPTRTRRDALLAAAAAAAVGGGPPRRARASVETDVREKKFPKAVFATSRPEATRYPAWLEGEWTARSEFAGYEFPSSLRKETIAREPSTPGFQKMSLAFVPDVGSAATFRVRFSRGRGNRGDDGVYEDRAFNLREIIDAYVGADAVEEVEYDAEKDANRTTIRLGRGASNNAERVELFTNGRASETRASDGTFFAREDFRQVTLGYSTNYGVARVAPTDYAHVWTYTPLPDAETPNDDASLDARRVGATGAPVVNRVRVTLSTAGYLQPNDALKYTASATTNPGGAPVPRVGAASALALEPVVLYSHVMLLERVGCVP